MNASSALAMSAGPLVANDAQGEQMIKLHKQGMSLHGI
jgi:hypothetical protein